jgi:hypothetical protein
MNPTGRIDSSRYRTKITDEWIPLYKAILLTLGWKDDDYLTLEIAGDCIIVTKCEDPSRPQS